MCGSIKLFVLRVIFFSYLLCFITILILQPTDQPTKVICYESILILKMSVIEANWSYKINIDEIELTRYSNFELSISNQCENVLKALKDSFLIENINFQANLAQTYDEELSRLIENNKELRQAIDLKLNQLTGKQTQYENYKQGNNIILKFKSIDKLFKEL